MRVDGRVLYFDIETHSADLLFTLPPREFVRLIGYAWDDGDVVLTTDLNEIRYQIMSAELIVGHNIHAFDLPAIFGTKSDVPLLLTEAGRVLDTWVKAPLVLPAPYRYINRDGKPRICDDPDKMTKFYALDELAHQLGVGGKTGDLRAMARVHGDPDLKGNARITSGYGRIPVDLPEYREYLVGDVVATRAVKEALLERAEMDDYDWREQRIAARFAVVSANGFKGNEAAARARVEELAQRRAPLVQLMVEKYGMPAEGAAPWATNDGKDAIFKALADHGITPETRPDWPLTDKGNLSLGGEALISLTEGTDAADLGEALAALKGMRSLAQLTLDSLHSDGYVHPSITMLQRSGRTSVTKPGLTIWTARGPGAVEREYYTADHKHHVLLDMDWSNADARAVAALSGDRRYAERFEPGADGHLINAWAAWGRDVVGDEKDAEGKPIGTTAYYRQKGKPLGHGWSYGGRPKTLSKQCNVPLEDAEAFVHGMDSTFEGIVKWQNKVRAFARKNGYVVNLWGRKMWVEKDRYYTQAPALLGQSTTREVACDFLLSLPIRALRKVKAFIHDSFLFSVPRATWREWRDYFAAKMTQHINPRGGLDMDFPVSCGAPAYDWYRASHA